MEIDLTNLAKMIPPIYYPAFKYKGRFLILYGGSGSGKSYFAADKFLIRTIKEDNHNLLCVRDTGKSVTKSQFPLLKGEVKRWGLSDLFKINESMGNEKITFKPNGNQIIFSGLDDVEKLKSMPSLLINGLSTGINAFAEQPVISGLMQITGYNDLFAGLANALQGVPASFVPTLFNQIKQLMDNDKRSTYSPDYFAETKNKAINKIPGLSETLPQQYGTFGQPLKTYQEGSGLTENNPFNALINPAFVNRYNPMPEAQKVLDIYNLSGENAVLPPVKQRYITYTPAGVKKSERIDLTPNEYAIYQQIAGDYARQQIAKLNVTGDAATMVKKMNGIISDASDRAKDTILNARGIKRKK